jgi:predicted HTH domain antitoxin
MRASDSLNLDEYVPEEKYLLMLLYAPTNGTAFGTALRGNLWLQKDMFLLTKAIEELKGLEFDGHHYGPYSPTVSAIQKQFKNSQIVEQKLEEGPIKLTSKGMSLAKQFWKDCSQEMRQILVEVKRLLNSMDKWQIISLIYSSYPETTKNSDVVYEFNKHRLRSAIDLFKQKKVSLEKASSISGLPLEDFISTLKKNGINAYEFDEMIFNEELDFVERFVRC